jgi:hypothetical protein
LESYALLGKMTRPHESVAGRCPASAVLDAYRYFKPESRWAIWSSRAMKIGWVVLVPK